MSCKGIERVCSVVGTIWNPHFLTAFLDVEAERWLQMDRVGKWKSPGERNRCISFFLRVGEEILFLSFSVEDSASDLTFKIDLWQKPGSSVWER